MTGTIIHYADLTDADRQSLRMSIRFYIRFALFSYLFVLAFFLTVAVIYSLFADMEDGWESRYISITSIFLVMLFFVAARMAIPCYRDLKTGKKLCITSDSYEIVEKKQDKFIRFSNPTQKDIEITSQNAALLSTEYSVYIEIAPRSKDVFSLVQNGKDLMVEEEDSNLG